MENAHYKIIEVVGTSSVSIEDAIHSIIQKSTETLEHLAWFEVMQVRGNLENNQLKHYQVVLKIGFRIEEKSEKTN